MTTAMANTHGASEPMFRAAKRRKVLRKRLDDDDDNDESRTAITGLPPSPATSTAGSSIMTPISKDTAPEIVQDSSLSMAEIMRRRKAGKPRRAGIEFSSNLQVSRDRSENSAFTGPVDIIDEAKSSLESASSRFAPQTGQVTDTLDKHMMAYIDSKMAKQHQPMSTTLTLSTTTTHLSNHSTHLPKERQPAGLGKLQEIDLGPSSTLSNIARTESALRKNSTPAPSSLAPAPPKINPRTGKPFRSRYPRRNSSDLARDALVDQVLRESRLEIYSEVPSTENDGADGMAADDRIAEQFRKEFLETQQARPVRKQPIPGATSQRGVKGEDKSRGPKLGGSRSARAKMAEEKSKK